MRFAAVLVLVTLLVVGCADGPNEVAYYDEVTYNYKTTLDSLVVNADQPVVVGTSFYAQIVTWDLANEPTEIDPYPRDAGQILVVDDEYAYISSYDHPVYRFDYRTGEVSELPEGAPVLPEDNSVTSSDNLVLGMIDDELVLWNPYEPTMVEPLAQSDAITGGTPIKHLGISDDYFYTTRELDDDRAVTEAWDRADPSATEPAATSGPRDWSWELTIGSSNVAYFVTEAGVETWDPDSGTRGLIEVDIPHTKVDLFDDERLAAVSSWDSSVIIELTTGDIVARNDDFVIYDVIDLVDGTVLVHGFAGSEADERFGEPGGPSLQIWSVDELLGR